MSYLFQAKLQFFSINSYWIHYMIVMCIDTLKCRLITKIYGKLCISGLSNNLIIAFKWRLLQESFQTVYNDSFCYFLLSDPQHCLHRFQDHSGFEKMTLKGHRREENFKITVALKRWHWKVTGEKREREKKKGSFIVYFPV